MRWTFDFVVQWAETKGCSVEKNKRKYSVWKTTDSSVVAECKNLKEVIDTVYEMGYN